MHPGLGQDEKNALRACTRIWRWLLQGKNNRPPKGVEHGPPSACFAACALRLRRPARRLGRLHGVGRAAPRPPGGFAPLRGLNGHAGTPLAVNQDAGGRGSFRPWGGAGVWAGDRKRWAAAKPEPPVGRLSTAGGRLSTRQASGARKPPATPEGSFQRWRTTYRVRSNGPQSRMDAGGHLQLRVVDLQP